MALIEVTPELLRGKATDLRNYKGQHDTSMQKFDTLINNLNVDWEGSSQQALLAKYQSMKAVFTNFSEMLEDYAKLMDTSAQQMENTDTELQSTMNNFG